MRIRHAKTPLLIDIDNPPINGIKMTNGLRIRDGLLIHVGVNYISSPIPQTGRRKGLDFQHHLMEQGVEVNEAKYPDNSIIVAILEPIPFEVRVSPAGPGVGQLLILGPRNPGNVELFGGLAEAVVEAYRQTWPAERHHLIACDATNRVLFETGADHAFKVLWEKRLGQTEDSLDTLNWPVLGGGLRLVMPITGEQVEKCLIEVKIESFLRDSSKLYVEAQFSWTTLAVDAEFDPIGRTRTVNEYIENQIRSFIRWEESGDGDNH